MKTGRPPKLTLEVREKIVNAIRQGNYRHVAAQWAGIGSTTFKRWMSLGKVQRRGPHASFRAAVLEAEQAAEIMAVSLIMKAAKIDWRAALAFLERKFPERWGRRDHHQVDANVRTTVKVNPDDAVEELRLLLAREAAASEADSAPPADVPRSG